MSAPVPDVIAMLGPSISDDMSDVLTEFVVVEFDPESAEAWGAFEEAALTEAEAWFANGDLSVGEAQAR